MQHYILKLSIRFIHIFLSLIILINPVFAIKSIEEGSVLTIDQCVDVALNNSPQIKIYENKKKISKSQVGQAKSDYSPTFGVGTGYYQQNNDRSGNISNSDSYYSVDMSVNQLLYNFGKTGAKIKMQKYNLEAAAFDLEDIIIDTVYNVKISYFGVLATKSNKEIQRQNVELNERAYKRTKAFFEEGLKSKIDLVNAEVNLSDSKIQLVNSENAYQTALIKLNNSMFVSSAPAYTIKSTESFNIKTHVVPVNINNVTDIVELEKVPKQEVHAVYSGNVEQRNILEDYVFKPFELSLDDAIAKAYKNRPDLKSLNALIEAMSESLKYVRREYFPELTGRVGYTMRNTNYYVSNGFNISAGLDMAAVNPFRTKFKIDEANAQLDLAKNNVELLKQNIYFEVQDAYVNMQQIEKRIPLLATKVKQALENYELADGRYEVGLGNFLELQDAKNNYNNAQLGYVQAVFDYNTARVKVEKAMGEK